MIWPLRCFVFQIPISRQSPNGNFGQQMRAGAGLLSASPVSACFTHFWISSSLLHVEGPRVHSFLFIVPLLLLSRIAQHLHRVRRCRVQVRQRWVRVTDPPQFCQSAWLGWVAPLLPSTSRALSKSLFSQSDKQVVCCSMIVTFGTILCQFFSLLAICSFGHVRRPACMSSSV